MSAIHDLDLSTYCGRIGGLYGRFRLCPPFALRDAAESWIARGIPLSHCVDVIERFLSRYAGFCYSGSGDWNFAWLNSLIQTSWYERSFEMQPAAERMSSHHRDRLGDCGSGEKRYLAGRRTPYAARLDGHDSRPTVTAQPGATPAKSASADQSLPPRGSRPRPPGKAPPDPKKIDTAVAWLRTELASGEQAAAIVEAQAWSAGIAPRTYDRARQRLGVTSRRIGFGRWAKYMIALPVLHGTPNAASTEAGVACPAQLSGNSKEARDVGQARKE